MALTQRRTMYLIKNNEGKEILLDQSEAYAVIHDLIIDHDIVDEIEEIAYLTLGKEEMQSRLPDFIDGYLGNIKTEDLEPILKKHAERMGMQCISQVQLDQDRADATEIGTRLENYRTRIAELEQAGKVGCAKIAEARVAGLERELDHARANARAQQKNAQSLGNDISELVGFNGGDDGDGLRNAVKKVVRERDELRERVVASSHIDWLDRLNEDKEQK